MSVKIRMKRPLSLCERCVFSTVIVRGEKVTTYCRLMDESGHDLIEDAESITECNMHKPIGGRSAHIPEDMEKQALIIDPNAGNGYA